MQKIAFPEEHIADALRQAETGTPVAEICRKLGVSAQTFSRWTKNCAGMGIAELRRLRQLEEANRTLKHLVADLTLDNHMLQEAIRNKRYSWPSNANASGCCVSAATSANGVPAKSLGSDARAIAL